MRPYDFRLRARLSKFVTIRSKIWDKDSLPALVQKQAHPSPRHPRENGGPALIDCRIWIPAYAGMTRERFYSLFCYFIFFLKRNRTYAGGINECVKIANQF